MKKVALVFILAVLVPSLVLAWLAVRSLRDQRIVLERQQTRLYHGATDAIAEKIRNFMAEKQREFAQQAETLLADQEPRALAMNFDGKLRASWPTVRVGFAVALDGNLMSPSLTASADARCFRRENELFLCSRETSEVFALANAWPAKQESESQGINASPDFQNKEVQTVFPNAAPSNVKPMADQQTWASQPEIQQNVVQQKMNLAKQKVGGKGGIRKVLPQKNYLSEDNLSKTAPSEAEFRQLIGDAMSGSLARFTQNKLSLMFWYRSLRDPKLVFGAEFDPKVFLPALAHQLLVDPSLDKEICIALLDDTGKPVARNKPQFAANWKNPFVATEIGEALPHWEVAAYVLNPQQINQTVQILNLTFGLMIGLLVLAIGSGGWLIFADLRRQLTLARQKTDFVSNVSHELKTPLTSIRMFSELLADGRVHDPVKQQNYLQIITAEAARLTRLINNVLDFAKMERGEKKYRFEALNLVELAGEIVENYRHHLEAGGFRLNHAAPKDSLFIRGDRDALAQVIVNLLSNAEKYGGDTKEISVEIRLDREPKPVAKVKVKDRGTGVPQECEEKIFEQFYRAHDSLNSGIQGSGLGLTLARQIARAHGGDIAYSARDGGGSCFTLELPVAHSNIRTT